MRIKELFNHEGYKHEIRSAWKNMKDISGVYTDPDFAIIGERQIPRWMAWAFVLSALITQLVCLFGLGVGLLLKMIVDAVGVLIVSFCAGVAIAVVYPFAWTLNHIAKKPDGRISRLLSRKRVK